jgi:hypothetical protein
MNAPHRRGILVALLLTAVAAGQIVQGSFENGVSGSTTMPAPWTSSGTSAQVFPAGSCTTESGIGFPSDGSKWVRITGGGGAATTASYAFTNNVAQTFTTGAAGTQLHLDVSFSTSEGPGNTFYDDFLAVSVSAGATTATLLTLQTSSASFPQTTCQFGPSTVKTSVVADIASYLPGITPSTPITLRVHCANVGDDAVASYGYVDNVYLGVPPPPPIDQTFVPSGGLWTFHVASPTHPNAQLFNLFALVTLTPTGSGPLFGINFDTTVLNEILSPLGAQPFHVLLDGSGNYAFGPIGIPGGLSADSVSVAVSGGSVVAVSAAKKFNF